MLAAVAIPATQLEAYERLKASGALGRAQFAVYEYIAFHPGCTRNELDRALGEGRPNANFSRRLAELERMGLLCRGPARPCAVTSHNCKVWTATGNSLPLRVRKGPSRRAQLEGAFRQIRTLLKSGGRKVLPDATLTTIERLVDEVAA